MDIKELFQLCDNVDEYSIFYCYDDENKYLCSSQCFAILSILEMNLVAPNEKIIKFYVFPGGKVDLLFQKNFTNY